MDKKKIEKVTTASLRDAMGRTADHDCQIIDLQSPTPQKVLWGQACIVQYIPFRKDKVDTIGNNFASLFYQAIGGQGEGKVLIMGGSGIEDASHGGGTKLIRLQKMNMSGVLCEGRLRDFHELEEYSFATYCHGEQTRWGTDVVMPQAVNVPIAFKGVTICPGDYIYAKGSTAIVVPELLVEQVIDGAIKIEEEDADFRETILNEDPQKVLEKGSFEN